MISVRIPPTAVSQGGFMRMRKPSATSIAALLAVVCIAAVAAWRILASAPAPPQPGEWAIIDAEGAWAGTARFSEVDPYGFAGNGLAAVRDAETGLWGYIDESGAWAIEPCYERTASFSANGLAPACDADTALWGFIDEKGEWVIEPRYALADPFLDDGLASVVDGQRAVWIDETGNVAERGSSPWDEEDAATGLYGVKIGDGSWGLAPSYAVLRRDYFSEYFLAGEQEDGPVGVIDIAGTWIVEPLFAGFTWDYAAEPLGAQDPDTGLWGYISRDGSWVVEPAFAGVTRMGDGGLALAQAPPEGPMPRWGSTPKWGSGITSIWGVSPKGGRGQRL